MMGNPKLDLSSRSSDGSRGHPLTPHRCSGPSLPLLVVAMCVATGGCRIWDPSRPAVDRALRHPLPPPSQFTGSGDESGLVDADEVNRTEEARAQVLAFINRLKNRPGPESTEGAKPTGFTPASEVGLPGGKGLVDRPGAQGSNEAISASRAQTPTTLESASAGTAPPEPGKAEESVARRATPPKILSVSIRQPIVTELSSQPSRKRERDSAGHSANRPLNNDDGSELAAGQPDAMIRDLKGRIARAPNDVTARWRLALLELATGQEGPPEDAYAEMSQESGLLLRRAVDVMAATQRALEDPVSGVADAIAAVNALQNSLGTRAELSIPVVAMCSRVQAFGVYDELPDGIFRALAPNQAIVYFEIKEFTSEPTPKGRFRTLLSDHFEVLTLEGKTLWQHDEPTIEDISRTRRKDFFVAQRIALPPTLRNGRYVLKVTVEDQLAGKRTQAIHEFQVGSS